MTLAACTTRPKVVSPDIAVPENFRFDLGDSSSKADTFWWKQLGDDALNRLIAIALLENKDIRIAAARMREFEAISDSFTANYFPQLNYFNVGTRGRELQQRNNVTSNFNSGISSRWELDLWGRIRYENEAAQAALLATAEAKRGAILTLVADVVDSYVNLLVLDLQLEISNRTLVERKEELNLFVLRHKNGYISDIEVAQVKFAYEAAAAAAPKIESAIAKQEHLLSLLLGRNPDAIARGKTLDQLTAPLPPSALPSDLLMRRPDIAQATQTLAQANALVGLAHTDYFPKISLTGLLGSSSEELSGLFKSPSAYWSSAATISGPLFTGGRIKARNKEARALRDQAVLRYEQTWQNALREVNDALIDYQKIKESKAAFTRETEALREYTRLARLSYIHGYSGYLQVLDAEQSLFLAELNLAQEQGDHLHSLITLYKVMGGGWFENTRE